MRCDDLTKEQCAAIRGKASDMVHYLAALKDRMDYKNFPACGDWNLSQCFRSCPNCLPWIQFDCEASRVSYPLVPS
jgi:hypothetical protein